jgi:hypothetical protein
VRLRPNQKATPVGLRDLTNADTELTDDVVEAAVAMWANEYQRGGIHSVQDRRDFGRRVFFA